MNIAIVRGPDLNKWEMQNYEPLIKEHNLTAYTTYNHKYDLNRIKIPVRMLHSTEDFISHLPGWARKRADKGAYYLGYNFRMFGLEKELQDKEIVHVTETYNGYSYQAIRAKKRSGLKVIVTCWENIPFVHRSSIKIKNEVRQNADAFIAVTNRAKEALILEGVSKEKIRVIPMGIDLDRFRPGEKDDRLLKKIGMSKEDLIVLFIGRLVWEKGVYDLLYASKKILKDPELKNISIKFLLVGSGPEKGRIEEMSEKLGISQNMKSIESFPYHEIHRLHNLTDLFVLPCRPTRSWQEQFGMALVEAMASGKPIISTLSGSIPEVVGEAGVLIQPNDFFLLYEEMKRLILNSERRARLGKLARKRAEERFDCNKVAEEIRGVYESL